MFKGLGNMAGMLQQAQEMQSKFKQMQEKLAELRLEGSAGGGMVTVTVDGTQKVLACNIEPSLIAAGDAEVIQDLVVSAANQAFEKVRTATTEQMSQLTGGMDLSGMGNLLGKFGLSPGGGNS